MTLRPPRPLTRKDITDQLDCGHPELDAWLRRHALMAATAGTAQTYVVCGPERRVRAYYALSPASVSRTAAPERFGHGVPEPFGVVLLARLAVDRRQQGSGVGSALVADAARRTLAAAALIGARALVVHASDLTAAAFYQRLGFVPFPSDELHLGVLLKDLRRRYGG